MWFKWNAIWTFKTCKNAHWFIVISDWFTIKKPIHIYKGWQLANNDVYIYTTLAGIIQHYRHFVEEKLINFEKICKKCLTNFLNLL